MYGIDASLEMLARAEKKSGKAGAVVSFKSGYAQALPFPDAQFDCALSTLMLHHLPRKAREQCAGEVRRVLKPGGRVLVVDLAVPAANQNGFFARFHRHGYVGVHDMSAMLGKVDLTIVESGAVGFLDLQFALATAPLR